MLSFVTAKIVCFLIVEFGPATVMWSSEHEFLLERLHVLVPSEASLACS
jgi:hypothetical protein